MISIIVVYNNERTLNEILLKSLKNQTAKFELIKLNNTKRQFKSAAEALNHGAKKAKGKYIMFVHQDVELDSDSWLENTENYLESMSNLGVAGVAGMSEQGTNYAERIRGFISNCGTIWGKPFEKPEEVHTLDELLLIVPRSIFNKLKFDEKNFDNWHCYGVDYCLCIQQMGLKVYVIPAFVYHRSLLTNVKDLIVYQKRLYNKHIKSFRYIYTTAGKINWLNLKIGKYFRFFQPFYRRIFPNWIEDLKREVSGFNTVLDLGCGYNSPIQYCKQHFSVGVELFEPYLLESKKKGIHNQYIKADIREIKFKPDSFDVILCSEVIEHLKKKEGYELIGRMEKWAKKKIIITVPNGYIWQDDLDNNKLQKHQSEWCAKELQNLGFKVYGMNGWKKLRGYKGLFKYKPDILWIVISDLTQKITYYLPQFAFQLFAVKQIDKKIN